MGRKQKRKVGIKTFFDPKLPGFASLSFLQLQIYATPSMFQGLGTGGEVDVELGPDPRYKLIRSQDATYQK